MDSEPGASLFKLPLEIICSRERRVQTPFLATVSGSCAAQLRKFPDRACSRCGPFFLSHVMLALAPRPARPFHFDVAAAGPVDKQIGRANGNLLGFCRCRLGVDGTACDTGSVRFGLC